MSRLIVAFLVWAAPYVHADPPGGGQGASKTAQNNQAGAKKPAFGTLSGLVVDAEGKPKAGARIEITRAPWEAPIGLVWPAVPVSDTQGRFEATMPAGAYFICAIPKIPDGPNESKGEVKTCYPSAPVDTAGVLTIVSGEVQQLTLRILQVKTYSVRGRVDTSMVRKAKGVGLEIRADSYYGCVNRDGSFLIAGLPAGSYTLFATAGLRVETLLCKPDQTGSSIVPAQASWTDFPPPYYFAERDLSLKRNLSGIVLKVKLDQTVIVE